MSAGERSVWSAMEDGPVALSAAGAARRERMMGEVARAAGARRARRVAVRAAGGVLVVVLVVGGVWAGMRGGAGRVERRGGEAVARGEGSGEKSRGLEGPAPGGGETAGARVVRVEIVGNEAGILERYAAGAPTVGARDIGDDELMRLMGEMGRPTGIVRTNGKVMLTRELERDAGEPVSVGREGDGVVRG